MAALGWVSFVWLPGFMLSATLRPRVGRVRHVAVGAILGVGVTMLVGQIWTWLDVSVRPATVLPLSLGAPSVGYMVSILLRRRQAAPDDGDQRDDKLTLVDLRWLVAAGAIGVTIWAWAIPSLSDVMPFIDGSHHGLFAYRIETLHTLNAHRVLSADLATGSPAYKYYPLALHLCVALVSSVTGVAINEVFVVGIVLAAAVLFPLGMFVLTRWLLPEAPIISRLSAVIAAIFPWFPFSPILWGAVPLIIAMSQVPAVLDAFGNVTEGERTLPTGVLLGVAAYGLFAEHNTELVTVAVFSVVLLLHGWRKLDSEVRRKRIGIAIVAAAIVGVLVLPSLHALSGGVTERTGNLGHGNGSGLSPLEWIVGAGNPAILLLALIGLAVALRRRWLLGWMWCLALTAVLFASTLHSPAILPWITVAWYSASSRLSYMFGFFAPAFAAIGLWVVFGWMRDRVTRADVRPRFAAVAPLVLIGLVLGMTVVPIGRIFVHAAYSTRSLVGADQRAAFSWLKAHVKPDGRVLNQFTDDSAWMEPLDGVTPLFAIDPQSVPPADWGDRWYLLNHAGALATDPRDQAAVARWDVSYVYVGARVFTHQPRRLFARQLSASPAYQEVWHQGSASIFAVVSG